MFKKILAAFGKGGAKIDLILEQDQYTLGDEVKGELIVFGGTTAQNINKMEVYLKCKAYYDGQNYEMTVHQIPLQASFQVQPHEQKSFPFHFVMPDNLLISGNYVQYYFETVLDISGGVDNKDYDSVVIVPPPMLQSVLHALATLGFQEKSDSREFDGRYQEFEFYPTGLLAGQAEELEFIASVLPHGLELLLELDARTFFGFEKEIKHHIFLDAELIEDHGRLVAHLESVLQDMMENGGSSSYSSSSYGYGHASPHYGDHSSSGSSGKALAGAAIGGFAAGAIGGIAGTMIASELMGDDDDDDDDDDGVDLAWSSDDEVEDFFGGGDDDEEEDV